MSRLGSITAPGEICDAGLQMAPLTRLRDFFSTFDDYFARQGYTRGCPVGNLSQEMADLSPAFQSKLQESIEAMATPLAEMITQAQERNEAPSRLDPRDTALFLIATWHGALLQMKVAKGPEPMQRFQEFVFEQILY
ncbi:MAG: TetR family transcriptional regulator C-terminal domain-containing protein [bacterium]